MTDLQEGAFYGWQKTSLIDYPGRVSAVLFAGGCSFACPYCYNCGLVRREHRPLPWEEVWSLLRRRKQVLQGLCISGGEPLAEAFLPGFLRQVRPLGYQIKLDTNGNHPDALSDLLAENLIDYVALDIKHSPQRYGEACGLAGYDPGPVRRSLEMLRRSGVEYELRVTVCRELHDCRDMHGVGEFAGPGEVIFLQPVSAVGVTLSGMAFTPPTAGELAAMASCLREYFESVRIRGEAHAG